MNINTSDLNLLTVFYALSKEKSTTRAAVSLGLSQPAVSHALNRLREMFKDPLFVRASRGLVPTKKALELHGPVEKLLKDAESLLSEQVSFDPKTEVREFRISTTEYFEVIALPQLLKRLAQEAPGIRIISSATQGSLQKEQFEKGSIDLAIAGYFGELPEGYYQQNVFKDDFICIGRKGNPHLKGTLTPSKYADARHILISPQGDMKSRSAAALKKLKFEQKFQAGVASFISPAWMIAESDLLLTCPRKLAEAYLKYLPLEISKLPFSLEGISVVQVWHARHHKDSAHTWLRGLIKDVCSSI
jgi:DNA-binding transcriptional LysR family regulator